MGQPVKSALLPTFAGLFLLTGLAAGHGGEGHIPHMNIVVQDIAGGAVADHRLEFEEGPLRAGWVFALIIAQQGGNMPLWVAVVSENGTEARNWTLQQGIVNKLTTLLPETGEYEVHLENPGNETARYGFYFDQSCNCAGKPIPAELNPGLVIFNVDAQRGRRVQANFPEPEGVAIKVTAAVLDGERGSWPEDFRVLGISTKPRDVRAREDLPVVKIHELIVKFEETGRIYFFVEPLHYRQFDSMDDLLVTPFYEPLEKKEAPGPHLLAVLVGVAALAVTVRRSRSK